VQQDNAVVVAFIVLEAGAGAEGTLQTPLLYQAVAVGGAHPLYPRFLT